MRKILKRFGAQRVAGGAVPVVCSAFCANIYLSRYLSRYLVAFIKYLGTTKNVAERFILATQGEVRTTTPQRFRCQRTPLRSRSVEPVSRRVKPSIREGCPAWTLLWGERTFSRLPERHVSYKAVHGVRPRQNKSKFGHYTYTLINQK